MIRVFVLSLILNECPSLGSPPEACWQWILGNVVLRLPASALWRRWSLNDGEFQEPFVTVGN